jgi:prophage maintenance system killer protein
LTEYITEEEIREFIEYNKDLVRKRKEPFNVDKEEFERIFSEINGEGYLGYTDKRERIVKKTSFIISSIVWKQPFDEGNKETALAIGLLFARRNGFTIDLVSHKKEIYHLLTNIAFKFENDTSIYTDMEDFLSLNFNKSVI